MRVLGLDYGTKTVGVAISDPLGLTAQSLETIFRKNPTHLRSTLRRIEELVNEYEAEKIVLGFPMNMDQSKGERCRETEEFKNMLEKRLGISVELEDERLTTVAAEEILIESGVRRENRKAVIDKIAAQIILQQYLDRQEA
ncbi:MAG: Holliday junction resolvase RuvX [Eubacterium sp.]|nr:Holliday junction resolvase RuvX [Eubacterium sp.]